MSGTTFGKETTFEDVAAVYPDQIRGRSFLITGGSTGLGLELAKSIAKHEAKTIILTSRSSERYASLRTLADGLCQAHSS